MDDQIRDNLVTSYISKSRKNNVFPASVGRIRFAEHQMEQSVSPPQLTSIFVSTRFY